MTSCPSVGVLVGYLVGWSVVIISKKGQKLHFYAPIGALVFVVHCMKSAMKKFNQTYFSTYAFFILKIASKVNIIGILLFLKLNT